MENVKKVGKEELSPNKISPNKMDQVEVAWRQLSFLREEILGHQKIRAQIIGVKITAVSLGIGYILDNSNMVHPTILIVVAYASVLFDFLLTSHSIAIKRAGLYIRTNLEKIIKAETNWPNEILLWEEFLAQKTSTQIFSIIGHFGLTLLASLLSFASPFMPTDQPNPIHPYIVYFLLAVLAIFLILDFRAFLRPLKYYGK